MDQFDTKTLADIYLKQGHFKEAYRILKTLAERDPSDIEVREKLDELTAKLNPSSPWPKRPVRSVEGRIRVLERWLANVRKRRR